MPSNVPPAATFGGFLLDLVITLSKVSPPQQVRRYSPVVFYWAAPGLEPVNAKVSVVTNAATGLLRSDVVPVNPLRPLAFFAESVKSHWRKAN